MRIMLNALVSGLCIPDYYIGCNKSGHSFVWERINMVGYQEQSAEMEADSVAASAARVAAPRNATEGISHSISSCGMVR